MSDNNYIFDDYEEMGSDESETSDVLKQLNQENDDSSSEEEVFPVHSGSELSDEESEDSENDTDVALNVSESDINEDDDDIPDSKAWGKKKRRYYNADNINDKINTLNEEDEEAAKLEEEEARAIQKRLISEIDDADLALDLLSDVIAEKKDEESKKEDEKIEIDLSSMSEPEKLALLNKECPELLVYIDDYKRLMVCTRDELLPVLKMLISSKLDHSGIGQFVKLYHQLIMNYCTNITFFILMRTQKVDTRSHPCNVWLRQYKTMLKNAERAYNVTYKAQIKTFLRDGVKPQLGARRKKITIKSNSDTVPWVQNGDVDQSDVTLNVDSELIFQKDDMLEEDVGKDTEGKRPITYQIAKNKGLTPHRKKELRNPRVKHRMKYRKAKIRRKGQVREVRPELNKYSGEISGIKAGVVKSVKFKV